MRRRINPYLMPSWLRTIRRLVGQLIIPFTIFQAIRTLIFPTTLDVFLLIFFLLIAIAYYLDIF
ncbi:hypothetical protein [Fervidibacillus halotolerans]|uniref:Membrane protein YszA n=1 Tax=Fervidibacillus halotolerans TaxID=2980027 RepID=A0A9E8LXP9_9BACI|nr:hypothetical protein [Fervidibacillus halotolerans]WAA11592.1 hypothetical protein OE105_08115 [Fervidibacillus halotolerans]